MTEPASPQDVSQEQAVLGIHTNTLPGAPLIDGHAWLTITRNGQTEAYGLWPNSHPLFADEDPHPTSNIRKGIENGFDATASRFYALTPDQLRVFESAVRENVTWGYTNTCASWASDTAYRVTGERVNASELLGLTDTPREIYDSIQALEKKRATTPDQPQPPADAERGSTSSSSLSARDVDNNPEFDRLLAAAGDPEALGQALREFAASSEQGRAFAAQVQARLQNAAAEQSAQQAPAQSAVERA